MLYKKSREKSLTDELFKNPTSEYRGSPFWGWNCRLDKKELFRQIDILKEMGFGGFHIHSRTGLVTEYLGEEFMSLVSDCCDKAKEENMLVGLYDEDRWPSGAAGGLVTKDKRFRQRYLLLTTKKMNVCFDFNEAYEKDIPYYLAEYNVLLNSEGELLKYSKTKQSASADEVKWYAYVLTYEPDSWYNNQTYVDTLSKEAIDRFIEITYDGYKNAIGEHFGATASSIFTDEPQFSRKGTLSFAKSREDVKIAWTMSLDKRFFDKYGFYISDRLPELFWELPNGEISRARYLYHDFVTYLFTEAFADNLGFWCEKNKIALTGHMLCEESLFLQTATIGEAMRAYRHFTIPGIDILCDNHEYTTAKQAQSAAHQYGREGVMSELYGVTGWDFDFRRHKAQGDWQAALGVTLRVLSVSWVTMKGDAKRDYPASINYQSDWYKEYSYIEDHFARVSTALTRGKPIVNVAVIHPVETMWLYFGSNEKTSDKRKMLDRQFHTLAEWLLSGTVDFDYICESLLPEQIGEISDSLAVGEMRYKAVIVAGCETLRKTTFDILERFHAAGGKIIFVGEAPKYIDAVCSDKPKRLFDLSLKSAFDKSEILNLLSDERDVSIYEENGERCECLCCQLRGDNGCKWLFIAHLCNEAGTIYKSNSDNLALARKRIIVIKGKYKPIIYDTLTGDIKQTDFEISGEKTFIGHTFYQNDSLLLKLCDPETAEKGTDEKKRQLISKEYITGKVDFSLTEPNALLLDIAEFALDGEPHWEREEIRKIQYIIKSELNIENGRAQAWATDEEENGHTVTLKYKFFSELDFSGAKLALEDAELSKVIFNGEKISIVPNGYFTDRQIKTIALPLIKKGENTLSVTLPVTRLTCLEACFVLGNFRVRLEGTEKTILPMREKIGFGDITAQGMPFYGARIEYFADIEAPRDCCASVSVRCYRGMLLRAELDGEQLGIIAFSPYEVYAPNVKKGKHRLKLTLYGSRYNCFGPLHVTDDKLLWQGPDAWKFMHDGKDRWKYEYSLKPMGIIAGPEIKYYI